MDKRLEHGCTQVWISYDSEPFSLCPGDFHIILEAWKRGDPFYAGNDLNEDELHLRLSDVVAIGFASPDSLLREEAIERELEE